MEGDSSRLRQGSEGMAYLCPREELHEKLFHQVCLLNRALSSTFELQYFPKTHPEERLHPPLYPLLGGTEQNQTCPLPSSEAKRQ